MTSPVQRAAQRVDEDFFVLNPDGSLVTQSTSAAYIAELLEWLDVPAGARVLEIGTGTGYSAAVLSQLVRPAGAVVSVDIDASLVERARALLEQAGIDNVSVLAADGTGGAPDHAPFDRVVAWATPQMIPTPWVEQAVPGAIIVTPVHLARLGRTEGIVRVRVANDASLVGDGLTEGGFAPLHPEVVTQWIVPVRNVDAVHTDPEGGQWWLSTAWAREERHAGRAQEILTGLLERLASHQAGGTADAAGYLTAGASTEEAVEDLVAFLLTLRPQGLTTASLGDREFWVGCTRPGGAALLQRSDQARSITVGDGTPNETLRSWIQVWRELGHPGWDDLEPKISRVEDGWQVRAALDSARDLASNVA